jgi:hypothetical protein
MDYLALATAINTLPDRAAAGKQANAAYVGGMMNAVQSALVSLAMDDPDGARERNGAGFCKMCQDGHKLAHADTLSAREWRRAFTIALCHGKQAGFSDTERKALATIRRGIDAMLAESVSVKRSANKYDGYCAARLDGCKRKVPAGHGKLARIDDARWGCVCAPCADKLKAKEDAKPRPAPAPVNPDDADWVTRRDGTIVPNKYAGTCVVCRKRVKAQAGVLGKLDGKWVNGHKLCAFPPKDGPDGTPKEDDATAFPFGANTPAETPATDDADAFLSALPEATRNALMPFQVDSIRWGAPRKRMLIGHEMGLGKTVIAISLIDASKGALVVGPACVQRNWEAELNRWRPELHVTCVDRRGFRWPRRNEVVIARWTSLPVANLKAGKGKRAPERAQAIDDALRSKYGKPPKGMALIADEIHYAKNARAQRHQAFRSVSRAVRWQGGRLIGLTGTPMLNNPIELRSILEVLGLLKEAFGDRDTFHDAYDMCRNRWGGWDYGTPRPEAREMLSTVMLRYLSQDVLKLPPIEYETIEVPLSLEATEACDALLSWAGSKEALEVLMEDAIEGRGGQKVANLFQKLSAMRRAVAVSKATPLLSLIDGNGKETCAVFSCHRAPVEALAEKGWGTITGDDSAEAKYDTACRFQDGELPGIAYTLAGCEGLTLTRATRLYIPSADWTPARNQQGIMRLWRIGQTATVKVTFLVGAHIVERTLHRCLARKMRLLEASGLQGSK